MKHKISGGIALALLAPVLAVLSTSPPAAAAPNEPIAPSTVLISEIANGGAGATSNANRVSADNFMEIRNYGDQPVDVSGWRLLRCGQTGDAYGPQKVFPEGTVLAPGDTWTVTGPTANAAIPRDAVYDETGSNLHDFGFGAWLETEDYTVVDRVGFYHPSVHSDCGQGDRVLTRPLDHRLNESHQRVAATGNVETDWIVATRTPDAANATTPADKLVETGLRITEVANGSPTADADQYVELTNQGSSPLDISGWKLYRCGENGTAYVQNTGLPAGSVVQPGGTYVISHTAAAASIPRQATYATGMHWRDFGAMIVRPDEKIADRVGFYENRNSICTAGSPQTANSDALQSESYHRVSDTGDNAVDFRLAQERSPGTVSTAAQLTAPAPFAHRAVRISEIVGAGPAGGADEFVEIGNYGDAPVNLAGWSMVRCEGTGKGNAGTQVADLGDVTLAPGQAYLMVDDSAPASLREAADALYVTGLNESEGYGAYLRDPQGDLVDAVGVYETVDYSPCVPFGSELRRYTKNDHGESYQRARTTGDNEEDFMKTPGRTPGVLADVAWIDPTEPLEGELDPVELEQVTVPGTPTVVGTAAAGGYTATVTTDDADGGDLQVGVRTADPVATDGTTIWAGSTARAVPPRLSIVGERRVATAPALTTEAGATAYPFQRFRVPVAGTPAPMEFTWTGRTSGRNEVQLYAWQGSEWELVTAGTASADGDLTLVGSVTPAHVVDGALNTLVVDGPRSSGGAVDEIGVEDRAFLDPDQYDVAINHATDTQFLSEGFRDVFRQMLTWVAANADARKIGYSTNSGDIIENWIGGNADPVRARKEFAAAKKIHQILNDADVPNGVLPGNHDNFWGRNNDLYNEYFGPEMYRDESWWGDSWKPGDNSAHYDFVEADGLKFLMLNLPYRPTQAQIDWAREVAAAYPDRNVVLYTHSYLTTEREIENRSNRYTARGEDIWSDLVAPSDNIFLVLGGHYHGVATKYGDPVTGEQVDAIEIADDAVAVRNTGATGRTVVQMLADYQGYRSTQPQPRGDTLDRDTGFQRLLQIDADSELMAVNTYSPHLQSFDAHTYDEAPYRGDQARYDATDDEFVAKIDLLVDRTLATSTWGLTTASTQAGAATVAAGAPAQVAVAGVTGGEVLHAVVTDPTGRVVRSTPLTVSLEEVPATATATALTTSRTSQRAGAADDDRALLTVAVSADQGAPAGTVELLDGAAVLGTVALADGEATWRLPDLAVGAHQLTARFVPSDPAAFAGSTSAPVTVTVTAPPAGTSATALSVSRTTQAYGAAPADRVRLTADVVATGAVSGTVEFRRGDVVVATAAVADGTASTVLPGTLAVGSHQLVAAYVPDDASVVTGSTSRPVTVTVGRAVATATARLARATVKPSRRGRLTVRVAAAGVTPTGQVTVTVRGNGRTRTVTGTLVAGKVVVTLPKLGRGSYAVTARYAGSSLVAPDAAPRVTLRVRK
ncbi:lamin tail domain-containing protein [Nocardioides sp. SYSU D00038]|uniref:lamin tail domain-containing protein n=1 Tax=Nocardioides sp. SYSU D00038 TaxID=2812554 RepID=UPI00196748A8|nr:lamin tail domain-containing protein [Nocardioides sp. SYSU D00038]